MSEERGAAASLAKRARRILPTKAGDLVVELLTEVLPKMARADKPPGLAELRADQLLEELSDLIQGFEA